MRTEPFRKYYKDRVADSSEFSVEIFKLKSFYKGGGGAPLTFVNRSELPTDQSKSLVSMEISV
jgi:hypothetical protein